MPTRQRRAELRRPQAAIAALRSASMGPIGASGQYTNRTELVHLLGRAHEMAGQADSASAHDRWVLAWRNADPQFSGRRTALRRPLELQSNEAI